MVVEPAHRHGHACDAPQCRYNTHWQWYTVKQSNTDRAGSRAGSDSVHHLREMTLRQLSTEQSPGKSRHMVVEAAHRQTSCPVVLWNSVPKFVDLGGRGHRTVDYFPLSLLILKK